MDNNSMTYILVAAIVLLLIVDFLLLRKTSKLSKKLADTEALRSVAEATIEEYKERYSQIFDVEA
ncbi:DUF4041 domain-containing protein, partial [Vibrio anguillarum]|nr:DUF4041 domain-containing protein [Vibrio anguillarum]